MHAYPDANLLWLFFRYAFLGSFLRLGYATGSFLVALFFRYAFLGSFLRLGYATGSFLVALFFRYAFLGSFLRFGYATGSFLVASFILTWHNEIFTILGSFLRFWLCHRVDPCSIIHNSMILCNICHPGVVPQVWLCHRVVPCSCIIIYIAY